MNNYSLKSPIFCLLVTVGCTAVPQDEKSAEKDSNYNQQIDALEEQPDKSGEYDSDEKRIEAARLASSEKDFKTVARILSSIKNPKKSLKNIFLIP